MKILFRTILLLVLVVTVGSCSKEKDEPEISLLSGTLWRCTTDLNWDENLENISLKFTSETTVEGWSKYKNTDQQQDWKGTYTLTGMAVTIEAGATEETLTGTISGVNMVVSNKGETNYLTFTLQ